jgi:phospholipase C
MKRSLLKTCSALVAASMILQPLVAARAIAQGTSGTPSPVVILAPGVTPDIQSYVNDPAGDPPLSDRDTINLLRHRVKYVFVLYQENRSFDSYFGTYRGANGLFSSGGTNPAPRPASQTPGFTQSFLNVDGSPATIQPFRIGPNQHAADTDDVDHSHVRMALKMDLPGGTGTPLMDQFAAVEEAKFNVSGATTLKGKQYGELAMAYVDCDTIPFLWNYANRFVLFDNIFQTVIGPSTPNALAMIAGQSGETQWVKHGPQLATPGTASSFQTPVVGDPVPFWGSPFDAQRAQNGQPQNPYGESYGLFAGGQAPNQTYASLPITLAGRNVTALLATDLNAGANQADIQSDIAAVAGFSKPTIPWGWYEEGYAAEPNEGLYRGRGNGGSATSTTPSPLGNPLVTPGAQAPAFGDTHNSYIAHHNGPQYFGYIADNPGENRYLHGLNNFFTDIQGGNLPGQGGVFYVRGGYQNIQGLTPDVTGLSPAEAAAVTASFQGDDDHPAYSDSQLSESLVAREINAIARSPYWSQSAIVITYDESEGDYDHVPPRILSFDPAGLPTSRGPRIPLLVISPYARTHVVSREEGDHNSVIKLINDVFALPALGDLPDEANARSSAATNPAFNGPNGTPNADLGPHDGAANAANTGALLSAFDPARLAGRSPPLPASYAEIPDALVSTLPHLNGQGCKMLGIQTEDRLQGIVNTIPADFNPRPGTFPGQGTIPLTSP